MTKILVQYAKDGKEWQEEHDVFQAEHGRLEGGVLTIFRPFNQVVAEVADVRGWCMVCDDPEEPQ